MNKEDITIDYNTCYKLSENDDFKANFLDDFETILKNTTKIYGICISKLFKDDDVRKLVLRNLVEVLRKTDSTSYIISEMSKDEIIDHVDDFFIEADNYLKLISDMEPIIGADKLLDLVAKNMDNIIKYNADRLPYIIDSIDGLINRNSGDKCNLLEMIDTALVKNIDIILSTYVSTDYKYESLNKMTLFKQKLKEMGPEVFCKFPILIGDNKYKKFTREDFKAICEAFSLEYDELSFILSRHCRCNPDKAKLVSIIIKELQEKSKGEDSEVIKEVGKGKYSYAYQVGQYVLKIGRAREKGELINHRRILQPIIRRKIQSRDPKDYRYCADEDNFFEVQNLVDTDWWEGMTEDQIKDVLYEIYSEIRTDGQIWTDVKKENVGRLKKANKANFTFKDIDGQEKDLEPSESAVGLKRPNKRKNTRSRRVCNNRFRLDIYL